MSTQFDGLMQLPQELRNKLASLCDGSVDDSDLPPASVTTAKIADGALTADATGRAKMADGFVTFAKTRQFISTEVTATGSSQSVAHGLGVIPTKVLIIPSELPADLTGGWDVAPGSHTTTNVVVTVTTGSKFMVMAWV